MSMPTPPSEPLEPGVAVSVRALRRLAAARSQALERCESCGVALPHEHRHMLDQERSALVCACAACALRYEHGGVARDRYRTVPQRYLALRDFDLPDTLWDELLIPVGMAFIYISTPARRPVAYYPSPAGATESLLSLERWASLLASNPVLDDLAPDVEALLINRLRGSHAYYLVPIDACFRLVGTIRAQWRGLSGGAEVWDAIETFFAELQARALEVEGASHARTHL